MKKRLTFLMAAFTLLAFLASPIGMWGQNRTEVTLQYTGSTTTNMTGNNDAATLGLNASDWSVVGNQHTNGSSHLYPGLNKNGYMALYWGTVVNTITVTNLNGYTISSITVNYVNNYANGKVYVDGEEVSGNNGSYTIGNSSFVIANGNTSNAQVRITSIIINYSTGGTETIAKPIISPNGGGFLNNQEVTITCATDGATIYYTTNGNDPTTSSTQYTAPFTITATTTVKAFAVKTGYDNSAIATATFTKSTPMTVAEARTFIDGLNGGTSDDVFVSGIISQIDQYYSNYHSITYWISDDGTTTDQLEVYSGKGLDGADFNSIEDLVLQSEVIVKGKLKKYNDIYEFNQTSQIVSLVPPTIVVATPVFNPNGGTFTEAQTVTITCATEGTTIYYTTDGSEPDDESTEYEGPFTVNETMTIKAKAYDAQDHESAVATATFTINLPYSGPAYARVNDVSYLTDGAKVIFAARYDDNATHYYAMSNTASGKPTGVQFESTTSGNFEVLPASILNSENSYCWTVGVTSNGYTFTNANGQTIGYTSGTNFAIGGDNTEWTIESGTTGAAAMVPDYTAFNIINFSTINASTVRAFALNNSHNFGPYALSNNNSADYNFSIDIFVQGAEPVAMPTITASDVNIEYNDESGLIAFTLNAQGTTGNVTAQVNGTPTIENFNLQALNNGEFPFTCSVNNSGSSRTALITLTYTYNRATITKDVTVTQAADPNYVMTIAEVRALSTGTTAITKGVVTHVATSGNNKTVYMQDNTAGIVVYGQFETDVVKGDEIRVEGELTVYHGLMEIGTNSNAPIVTVLSQNNTVTPAVKTIDQISNDIQAQLVRVENATVTAIDGANTTIAQGQNTIVVRNLSDVAENDVVTLTANVGCYDNPQLVNPTDVTVQQNTNPVINANNVTLAYNATSGEIAYTITNPVTGTVLNATTNADWISNINVGSESVTFTTTVNEGDADRTATITLSYAGANNKEVTVTQEHFVIDYATLPFSFNGGIGDIANTAGLTQHGLGGDYGSEPKLKFDSEGDYLILHFDGVPGILSFDIKGNTGSGDWAGTFTLQTSEDGVTYTDLATYTDLTSTVQSEVFNTLGANVRYIKWIFTAKDNGNVGLGNIVLQPYVAPQEYTLTVSNLVDVNTYVFDAANQNNMLLEGEGSVQIYSGTQVLISVDVEDGYVLESLMVDGENVISQIDGTGAYTFTMPTHNVTITASAVEQIVPSDGDYVRISSLDQLTDGSIVVIAARYNEENTNGYYAMPGVTSGKPAGVAFTSEISGTDEILPSSIVDDEDDYYWVVNVTENGYTFTNANGQMIGYTSGTNFATGGDNTAWTITLGTAEETAMVAEYTGFVIRNGNTTDRAFAFNGTAFGAYSTTNMTAAGYNFFLDFFVQTAAPQTVTQTIELSAGWNWFSTYVEIELSDLQNALVDALPGATSMDIKSAAGNDHYNGSRWRATTTFVWDVTRMFMINVPEACEIELTGMPINPVEHPIIITPGEANWIGFPYSESVAYSAALPVDFQPVSGETIKSADGSLRYTGSRWRATNFTNFEPNKGYIYDSQADTERTLIFQNGSSKAKKNTK